MRPEGVKPVGDVWRYNQSAVIGVCVAEVGGDVFGRVWKDCSVLVITTLDGPDKGKRFELPDNEPQLIGRSSEALPLTDSTISRRHAELTPDEGAWFVNDLNSANGTYVNGHRITAPHRLRDGDQIRTGASLFVYGDIKPPVHEIDVLPSDKIDVSVESTVSAYEQSVIMAVPDPSEAAIEHLRVLYDLTQLLNSIFDRQGLLERVMDIVFEHFRPDRGVIMIRASQHEELKPIVVRYRKEPEGKSDKFSVSHTIVEHVERKNEGVLSSNAMTDRRFSGGDSIQVAGIRSAICVPIQFRDRNFGVIYIDSLVANYTYTDDQLRLMTAIGSQTAMALGNVELYEQGVQQARLAAAGETVASLSHSIRNILQAIRGGAEVVEMGLRKQDLTLVANGWEVLSRNLDRIYELTMNMLAFAKQRRPEFENVDLREFFDEVVALFKPQCDRASVGLTFELEEDVPPLPCDPAGLHQAIMNLLTNALDAVKPGEGRIAVRIEHDPDEELAYITIQDNGQGIGNDSLKRLFTPFYSTKGLRGTGLGLPVTKKIIEEHGGNIAVSSRPGGGATFIITLSTETRQDPSETIGSFKDL
ncbi:MAG: FHA domain-containing protein [Phycisphaera sp.]|nr:FHA domain-containing protein [Phycisphaera sp.]